MHRVIVDLGDRTYAVHIGRSIDHELWDDLRRHIHAGATAVIADERVADLHASTLAASLPASPPPVRVPTGEACKTLAVVERVAFELAARRVDRAGLIVSFGGGAVGDLAGFVASIWARGVRVAHVPTTLLAAVDASVGGKTAVNIPAGKNLVGTFHQPVAVTINTGFFATLPDAEYVSGLAESVKHAAARDPEFFAWHERMADAIAAREPGVAPELVRRNCQIKADVVAADEREAGLRMVLNVGHTIGHAIEAELDYALPHGQCVALGMRAENALAVARGLLAPSVAQRIGALLARFGLPAKLPRVLDPGAIFDRCAVDKKAAAGDVRYALLTDLGAWAPATGVTRDELSAALSTVLPG